FAISTLLAAIPVRQHAVQDRKIASASSRRTSLRLLNFIKSSREVITWGRFETVKTVEPWEEKVGATGWSRPLIIVTTAITAVTPTMIPIRVRPVRNLFCRRLAAATQKASHKAAIRKNRDARTLATRPLRSVV